MAKTFNGKRPENLRRTLGKLFAYLGRHKFLLVLVGILAAVSASANLLGTYMIKPIVNQVTENGDVSLLLRNVAIAAAIFGTGALSTLGYTQIMVRAAQKVLCDIRRDLYGHLQKLSLEYFDSQRKGDLMSLFTNDVDTISDALNNSFAMIIQSFIQIIGTLTLLFILNWRLSYLLSWVMEPCFFTSATAPEKANFILTAIRLTSANWTLILKKWWQARKW